MEKVKEKQKTKEESDFGMSYCYGGDGSGRWLIEDKSITLNTIPEIYETENDNKGEK